MYPLCAHTNRIGSLLRFYRHEKNSSHRFKVKRFPFLKYYTKSFGSYTTTMLLHLRWTKLAIACAFATVASNYCINGFTVKPSTVVKVGYGTISTGRSVLADPTTGRGANGKTEQTSKKNGRVRGAAKNPRAKSGKNNKKGNKSKYGYFYRRNKKNTASQKSISPEDAEEVVAMVVDSASVETKQPTINEKKSSKVKGQRNNRSKTSRSKNGKRSKGKGRGKGKGKLLPLKNIKVGSEMSGKVVDLCSFGAFVQTKYAIPGTHAGCALLHISQIQDKKVNDINDVLKKGQLIENARFISVDEEKGEVRISLRKKKARRKSLKQMRVGDVIEGKILSITDYGAFVDVNCKNSALMHKSQMSEKKVDDVADIVKVGQKVRVQITDVDMKKKNMACSMCTSNGRKKVNIAGIIDRMNKGESVDKEVGQLDGDSLDTLKTQLKVCDMISELESSLDGEEVGIWKKN